MGRRLMTDAAEQDPSERKDCGGNPHHGPAVRAPLARGSNEVRRFVGVRQFERGGPIPESLTQTFLYVEVRPHSTSLS
jgi:hypothetical protein